MSTRIHIEATAASDWQGMTLDELSAFARRAKDAGVAPETQVAVSVREMPGDEFPRVQILELSVEDES